MRIEDLIRLGIEQQASDLHLSTGQPPALRIDGNIILLDQSLLDENSLTEFIRQTLSKEKYAQLVTRREMDYTFAFMQRRIRANVFYQYYGISLSLRYLAVIVPTLDDLQLPKQVSKFIAHQHGLIIVTGATGSGKSTTLAALIEYMNSTQDRHIITLEDPIEMLYTSKKCLIQQREVHEHTSSFATALRAALRQDPDVILLGEMRDSETIQLALTAAETGHLVLATLHAPTTIQAIDRVIQAFPGDQQLSVSAQLSRTLQVILAQSLIVKPEGGRMAVCEILLMNTAIANLIRENKLTQIHSVLQMNQSDGMQTFEQAYHQINSIMKNRGVIQDALR